MNAENEMDLSYFCTNTFDDAEKFGLNMSNDQHLQYATVPIHDEKPPIVEQHSVQTKRKRITGRISKKVSKKPRTEETPVNVISDVVKSESCQSQFVQDKQLLLLHTEYLKNIKPLTTGNNQLLTELKKTIKDLHDKIQTSCCQICKLTPEAHPLRLMGESCGHKFCCGSCAGEYLKQMLQENEHVCLVCKQNGKILCCK